MKPSPLAKGASVYGLPSLVSLTLATYLRGSCLPRELVQSVLNYMKYVARKLPAKDRPGAHLYLLCACMHVQSR